MALSRVYVRLRQAIDDVLARELGRSVAPEREVLVTGGAMQGLDVTLGALLGPDDEAVAPLPNFFLDWFFQRQNTRLVGVPCEPKSEYAIDWDHVEGSISARTRLVFVTTPANPTGYV